MAQSKASIAKSIGFVHVPSDAVGYELVSLNNSVTYSADGTPSVPLVSVTPYVIEGSSRTRLPVNGEAKAAHSVFLRRMQGDTETSPARVTSAATTTAVFKSSRWARFDLVANPDVTSTPSGSLVKYSYPESAVLASLMVTIARDGEDGEPGAFTSIVFTRSASRPAAPSGGTYGNPVPDTAGWSDAPESGGAPLWMSRARFTTDMTGEAGKPSPEWSEPSPCEDSSGIEYIWCKTPRLTVIPANTHPYPDIQGAPWGKDASGAVWMAVALKNNGVWSDWSIVKVKGEDGEDGWFVNVTPETVQLVKGAGKPIPVTIEAFCGSKGGKVQQVGGFVNLDIPGIKCLSQLIENGTFKAILQYDGTTEVNTPVSVRVTTDGGPVIAKSISFTTVNNGATGPAGPYIPPPMPWEHYPDNYEFLSGASGEARKDVVIVTYGGGLFMYACIRSHVKTSTQPYDDPDNWKMSDLSGYRFIATDLMLADSAYIKLLSSTGIRIYTPDGKIVGAMSSVQGSPKSGGVVLPFFIGGVMRDNGVFAEDPMFGVGSDGKAYYGGTKGQRIEVDPVEKVINIFGDDGRLCAVHSGREIDYTKVAQDTAASGDVTVAQPSVLPSTSFQASGSKTVKAVPGKTVKARGELEVSVPQFRITAKKGGSGSMMGMAPSAAGYVSLRFIVNGNVRSTRHIGEASDGSAVTGAGYGDVTTGAFTFRESLNDGDTYSIEIVFSATLVNPVPTSKGTVTAMAAGPLSASYTGAAYRAEYGRNGLAIVTNSKNYVYALFDASGVLHFKAVSAGKTIVSSD